MAWSNDTRVRSSRHIHILLFNLLYSFFTEVVPSPSTRIINCTLRRWINGNGIARNNTNTLWIPFFISVRNEMNHVFLIPMGNSTGRDTQRVQVIPFPYSTNAFSSFFFFLYFSFFSFLLFFLSSLFRCWLKRG